MITSISGKIFNFGEDYVDLLVGGFGVRVLVPKNTLGSLGKEDSEVTLLTNFQFRDESLILYGFTHEEMRKAFELLITVNGVGPKAALNILSILNSNVILLGLNLSSKGTNLVPFYNFHYKKSFANDYKIRFAFKGSPF